MQPARELHPNSYPGIGISSISRETVPDAKSIPLIANEVNGKQEARSAVMTS